MKPDPEETAHHSLLAYALIVSFVFGLFAVSPQVQATHDPNDFFALEANFPGVVWEDIHGTATTQWAVGNSAGRAFVAKRTAGVWAADTAFNNQNFPGLGKDIFAVTDSDVWLVGGFPDVLASVGTTLLVHWDGVAWTSSGYGLSININYGLNVWATAANSVWVSGGEAVPSTAGLVNNGVVNFWDGATWTRQGSVALGSTSAVVDSGGSFEIGTGGLYGVCTPLICGYRQRSGATWTGANTGGFFTSRAQGDLWGTSASNIWRVGSPQNPTIGQGLIQRWDGADWVSAVGAPQSFHAIYGSAASDIWAAGDSSQIYYFDGTSWTDHTASHATTMANAQGVYCSSSTACWIVYDDGQIHKLQVNAAVPIPSLLGFTYGPDNIDISASQAQCLGDGASFAVNHEPPLPVADVLTGYVIRSSDNVVIETLADASWFNLNRAFFHQDKTYPTGGYALLVLIDHLVGQDNFMGVAFNVPQNDCFGEDSTDEFAQVFAEHSNQTDAHNHGDLHHHNIEAIVDSLAIGVGIFAGTLLGSTSTINILVLVLTVFLAYHMYRRTTDFVLRTVWTMVILMVSIACLEFVNDWKGMALIAGIIGVFSFYLMWKTAIDYYEEKRQRRTAPITDHD